LAILIISLWFHVGLREAFFNVCFGLICVFFEQDIGSLRKKHFVVTFVVTMWTFLVISLRQFYTSSLYSFMTAEPASDDADLSLEQVLHRDDYDLIIAHQLHCIDLKNIVPVNLGDSVMSPKLASFYQRLLLNGKVLFGSALNAVVMTHLRDAANGNLVQVCLFTPTETQGGDISMQ